MIKKLIKFIGIILGIILLLLIVLVIMSIDGKDINNPQVVSDNKSTETVVNNALYEKTIDVKTENDANITFDEEELEYLLYPIFMGMNEQISGFEFTGVNIDVDNGEYFVKVSGKSLGFYKTVAYAKLDFSFDNKVFEIKLNSLKLGKLGLTGFGKILLSFVSEKELERSLEESGIYLDFNKSDLSIKMTLEDIENTLTKQTEEGNKELVSLLFDIFLANNDLLELNLGDNDLFGAIVHLGEARYDDAIHGELKYDYDFDAIKAKAETLLSNKSITSKELVETFNYLVKGYNHIDEDEKKVIDNIDFTSIGINVNSLYEGIIDRSDLSMSSYIESIFVGKTLIQVANTLKDGIIIPDATLTGILQNLDFVGYSYAFSNEEGKVGYFVLEQFDFTCLEEYLKMDLIGNLNGLQICIEVGINCFDENANGLTITGDVHKLLIGSYDLKESQEVKLLQYLKKEFADTNWISVDVEKEQMTLDFSQAMADAISSNPILNSVIADSMNATKKTYIKEGYISIKYSIGD